MKLSAYSEFKDSGSIHLGQIPRHWRLLKLKVFTLFLGGGTPSREVREYWGGTIPWVSPKDMKTELINQSEECVTQEGLMASSGILIPSRSVLVVVRSGILKHTIPVAISQVPVTLNQDIKALIFAKDTCSSIFFLRVVQGLNVSLLSMWLKEGATVESLEHRNMQETVLALPLVGEQNDITAFLKCETGKIDALIAQQEKLLKLLAEKRQATISKAVTHGLDHKVSTKLSGHEFVGSIPSHWCIYPVKAVATINDESLPEDTEPDFELSYVDIGNVSLNRGIEGTEVLSFAEAPSRARRIARHGDVIISTVRTYLKAIAPIVNPPSNLIVSTGFAVIRPKQNLSSAFAKYAMQSAAFIDEIISKSTGVSYPAINASDLGRMALPIPPLDEQAAISAFLENTTKALDALIKIQNRANHLLKERRTALISAAVTGKIDVRDYVDDEAPAMNAAPIA